VKNFFSSVTLRPTPEFLSLYGLDSTLYEPYDVVTQENIQTPVRMEGWNLNYKQALTFLPRPARGVQVFANASKQRLLGDINANFAGFIPFSASWGVSLTREKWNALVNWNYRGLQRLAPITGAGIEPGTFTYNSKLMYVDVSAMPQRTPRYTDQTRQPPRVSACGGTTIRCGRWA